MLQLQCAPIYRRVATGQPTLHHIDMASFMGRLQGRMARVWNDVLELNPRADSLPGGTRMATTYHAWMAVPWRGDGRPPLPHYLSGRLPADVMRDVARFRLSSHYLKVETGRWHEIPRRDRVCDMCGLGQVQDEHHVLLECPVMADIRGRFDSVLDFAGGDVHKLMACKRDDAAWFVSSCFRRV